MAIRIKVRTHEATKARTTGTKKRVDFSKAKNKGYIFEAVDKQLEELKASQKILEEAGQACDEVLESIEELEKHKDELTKIGASAIRTALVNLRSPEREKEAAIEKEVKETVKALYKNTDLGTCKEMVITLKSKYATNGKSVLMAEGHAIEESKDVLQDSELTDDVIMDFITLTRSSTRQSNAGGAKAVAPVLAKTEELLNSAAECCESISRDKVVEMLGETQKMLKELLEKFSATTEVVSTDIVPVNKDQLDDIPKESLNEGFFDKVKDAFRDVLNAIKSMFSAVLGNLNVATADAEDSIDTFNDASDVLMDYGYAIARAEEARDTLSKHFARVKESISKACSKVLEDVQCANICDEELFMVSQALDNAEESLSCLKESVENLKSIASIPVNEGNMEVVGILADAIQQIAADTAAEEGEAEGEDEDSLSSEISNTYDGEGEGGEGEEGEGGEEGGGEGLPPI